MDSFDSAKANNESPLDSWVRELKIASYGKIISVIDSNTVEVEYSVQTSEIMQKTIVVTLLSISSLLFEINIKPIKGDKVLVLFLDSYNTKMFSDDAVVDKTKNAFTVNTAVGILVRVTKMVSAFTASFGGTSDNPILSLESKAPMMKSILDDIKLMFVSGNGEKHIIDITIEDNRPLSFTMLSEITMSLQNNISVVIGVDADDENVDAAVDITLGEKSPLTIKSSSAIDITLEKDSPITIKSSSEMDVTFDGAISLMSSGSKLVGIGNSIDTIGGLFSDLLGYLSDEKMVVTMGSPAAHFFSPAFIAVIKALAEKSSKVLK